MSAEDEIYVTSRSRTPSVIEVTSQTQHVFRQLPDLIQEAALSTECKYLILWRWVWSNQS